MTEKQLLRQIKTVEDTLARLTTKLWKLVDPTSEEIEVAHDVMASHDDNYDPTDLEILRHIISCRH